MALNTKHCFRLQKQKAKAMSDSLTKESASYKEMLYEKEKAFDVRVCLSLDLVYP